MHQVIPQCVKEFVRPTEKDTLGNLVHPEVDFLAVNYVMLIPILVAGIKEQQQQIDSLISALNNQPKPNGGNINQQQKTGAIEVELNNQNKIILNQNNPNPFAENTTITYHIPENVTKAEIYFYDNTGTILKTVLINEKGTGSLMVYGSNLTSGTYSYTLLADGNVIETKKMVKVK